ncbi:apotyrosinase chaperone MelC1 [Streptomyces chartreusis]|uniref:apotyrosinase chaperone MelC1 n=1 Tax=Streptomyces chartreusis TaxID=1969 RepID=UPI002E17ED33
MSAPSRRHVLRGSLAGLAGAGLGLCVSAPSVGAVRRAGQPRVDQPPAFDETYKGRRIQGKPTHGEIGHHGGGHHGGGYTVLIDGEELHVMRNADTTWISVVNHYEPFPTPRDVARAAVDELQGATLVPLV